MLFKQEIYLSVPNIYQVHLIINQNLILQKTEIVPIRINLIFAILKKEKKQYTHILLHLPPLKIKKKIKKKKNPI